MSDRTDYLRKWRSDNRQKINSQRRERRSRNREKYRESDRRWREKRKQEIGVAEWKKREREKALRVYHRNPEPAKQRMRAWKLANPEWVKQWTHKNRAKINNAMRKWKAANPERAKELYYNWYRKNPDYVRRQSRIANIVRRARLAKCAGTFTFAQLIHRVEMFGWKCRYCRTALCESTLTVDHQIPICNGGSNWPSNLVPACSRCNKSKGKKSIRDFKPSSPEPAR